MPAGPRTREAQMLDLILGGAVAAGLALYLLYALLHPEKL
jgi:K+-transporting ATPase KdpF subunit